MISLVSVFVSYMLAVFVGTRSRRIGGNTLFILTLIAVVQVIIVLISMFLMAPPPGGHPDQG